MDGGGAPSGEGRNGPVGGWDGLWYAVMAVAWGGNYLVVRNLVDTGAPVWIAALRAATGAATAAVLLMATGHSRGLDRRGRRDAFAIGVVNTGAMYGLWFVAAGAVPPSVTSVVVYTFPLQVAILSGPLLGDRPTAAEGIALGMGLGGVALVAEPWSGSGLPALPVLALLLSAFSWAVGTILFRRRFSGGGLVEANAYQLMGGAAGLAVAGALFEPTTAPAFGPGFWVEMAYLGVIGTGIAYYIWFRLLQSHSAVRLSGGTFLVPVVALALSAVVLGERLDAVQIAGVAAVLLALVVLARFRRANPTRRGLPEAAA